MGMAATENGGDITGQVLVVDDNPMTRTLHRGMLARQFDVVTAGSGAEALATCQQRMPELILLDIEMPEMDGIEACRRLRETTTTPIIFATSHESLDEHLQAYDAGGDDIIVKPVNSDILLRKVKNAIRQHREKTVLVAEKDSLHEMAMSFLSNMGQSGALLTFMRTSVTCRSHQALAENLLTTAADLGLQCSVMIRHVGGPTVVTPRGEPTPLEREVLEKSVTMGRQFHFMRRMVVNYDRVSLLVANMPNADADPERTVRLGNYAAILAETAEAMCDNVDMRLESMQRAEQLQVALGGAVATVESLHRNYQALLIDTRMLLQNLVDNIERSYTWLDTSQSQEAAINKTMDDSVQRILALLMENSHRFDVQFGQVIDALRGGNGAESDLELF